MPLFFSRTQDQNRITVKYTLAPLVLPAAVVFFAAYHLWDYGLINLTLRYILALSAAGFIAGHCWETSKADRELKEALAQGRATVKGHKWSFLHPRVCVIINPPPGARPWEAKQPSPEVAVIERAFYFRAERPLTVTLTYKTPLSEIIAFLLGLVMIFLIGDALNLRAGWALLLLVLWLAGFGAAYWYFLGAAESEIARALAQGRAKITGSRWRPGHPLVAVIRKSGPWWP